MFVSAEFPVGETASLFDYHATKERKLANHRDERMRNGFSRTKTRDPKRQCIASDPMTKLDDTFLLSSS
jgi:hypothetical protein